MNIKNKSIISFLWASVISGVLYSAIDTIKNKTDKIITHKSTPAKIVKTNNHIVKEKCGSNMKAKNKYLCDKLLWNKERTKKKISIMEEKCGSNMKAKNKVICSTIEHIANNGMVQKLKTNKKEWPVKSFLYSFQDNETQKITNNSTWLSRSFINYINKKKNN